ncbi:DUF4271 domain-containing protein [Flavobacteriaceae bacterium S0825]|uniref:DUF4271 domain-containing protein n=1 Tax=Gaetbulibacter sp. S0825 TaxID=2720084 RepID=UPI00142FECD7|nr:DUF4271 domain-containing protein [Gaetbulibacter sp. S0825]MCK0107950.1 DUF4271 domain-containing protein [Flavobacteriaceae bacterium S0825]NIX63586.1 DUF4271 domain-containing protein [Gaetbulibacter sp. S0825]
MLREIISNEWYVIFFVLCLSILALAKRSFSTRFNDFLLLVGKSKYLKIYARDQKFIDQFDALLFINLMISLSLFCFLGYSTFIDSIPFNLGTFLKILLGIGSIILIKILLERLIGSLFGIDTLMDSYLFQKTNYKNYTGLLLLPINILLVFTIPLSVNVFYVIFGLIFIINLIGFITSIKTHQKTIINNIFYFILYLCALEIAPYVILYKLFINS